VIVDAYGLADAGLDLLAMAETGPLGELERAHADLVRAQVAYVTRRGRDAPALLVNAAKRLEPIDPRLARATYMDAMMAALFAGRFAAPGGSVLDVARQVSASSVPALTASDLRRRAGAHPLAGRGLAAGPHPVGCLRRSPGETAVGPGV
jgi:hypothetical protein